MDSRYATFCDALYRNDYGTVRDHLGRDPGLASLRLPNGEVALRAALRLPDRALFDLLDIHGAEHDILTACASGRVETIASAIKACRNINADRDLDGNTALHWACTRRFARETEPSGAAISATDIIALLVREDIDIDAVNRYDETPIHWAAIEGERDYVVALASHGACLDMFAATLVDDHATLETLIRDSSWRMALHDRFMLSTPLHIAAADSSLTTLRLLLETCININAADRRGFAPLHRAVRRRRRETASLLLTSGANVDQQDHRGLTSLQWAVLYDAMDIVRLLLEHGSDPNLPDRLGRTALHEAETAAVASLLLDAGASLDSVSLWGDTPLHAQIRHGRFEAAVRLLERGAKADVLAWAGLGKDSEVLNMVTKDPPLLELSGGQGWKPLHFAASLGHGEVVRWLLDFGADIGTSDAFGNTALHLAAANNQPEVVRILLDRGADRSSRNDSGRTPHAEALAREAVESVALLKSIRPEP